MFSGVTEEATLRTMTWQVPTLLMLFALLGWTRNRKLQTLGLVIVLLLVNSGMSRQAIEMPGRALWNHVRT